MSEGVKVHWPPAKVFRSYLPHLKSRPPVIVPYASIALGIDDEYDSLQAAEARYAEQARAFGFVSSDEGVELTGAWVRLDGVGGDPVREEDHPTPISDAKLVEIIRAGVAAGLPGFVVDTYVCGGGTQVQVTAVRGDWRRGLKAPRGYDDQAPYQFDNPADVNRFVGMAVSLLKRRYETERED